MEALAQLNPVTKSFLAGSLSGTCSTLLFQVGVRTFCESGLSMCS